MTVAEERVVLLDEQGNDIGSAPKADVHDTSTPLHLAFSCYVFGRDETLLLTRRALDKATFPGTWTNTVCGHPGPGEDLAAAVVRRARQELGMNLEHVRLVLPRFRYRAVMANGVVENEMCPVFTAVSDDPARPDPTEVDSVRRQPWAEVVADVLTGRAELSPWCTEQVLELVALGSRPGDWPTGDPAELPPAARPPR